MVALNRKKLKDTRKKMNLTQEELAEQAGTTDRTIRYIENEKTTPLSGTLQKICKTLNLSVDSVIISQNGDENDV